MANITIKIKQSSVAGKVPTASQLEQGELALNTSDQKLYSKDSSGVIFSIKADAVFPLQAGNRGKVLQSDGTDATWQDPPFHIMMGDSTDKEASAIWDLT